MDSVHVKRREGLYGFEYLETDARRSEKSDRKTYEIKSLWQRSHEIVNLSVRGLNNNDIASILNITPQCVSNTLNSRLGELKLADIRKSRDDEARIVNEKIRVLTNKALATYHEIFDDESGECNLNDKKKVADTVLLELSGLRAPTRIQTSSAHYTLSKEDLDAFKARAMKTAREAGIIIDVKPKDVDVVKRETECFQRLPRAQVQVHDPEQAQVQSQGLGQTRAQNPEQLLKETETV